MLDRTTVKDNNNPIGKMVEGVKIKHNPAMMLVKRFNEIGPFEPVIMISRFDFTKCLLK